MTTQLLCLPGETATFPLAGDEEYDLAEQSSRLAEQPLHPLAPGALLLGCENVLYDATVWDRWLVRLLKHVGVAIDQASFGTQWGRRFSREIHRGRREFDEAFRSFLHQLGLSRGLADEVAAASQGRRHQFLKETRSLPHIRQTIAAIAKKDVAVGILADSELTAAELERHITRLGFGGKFCFVLSSVEIGATKSETEAYRIAAARFGQPPERIAFVGSFAEHLDAAAELHMPTIAFNHEESALADLYIRQFDELIAIFQNWGQAGDGSWVAASVRSRS